jgi:hypothetical protein
MGEGAEFPKDAESLRSVSGTGIFILSSTMGEDKGSKLSLTNLVRYWTIVGS